MNRLKNKEMMRENPVIKRINSALVKYLGISGSIKNRRLKTMIPIRVK
jgi:hypothetical protein